MEASILFSVWVSVFGIIGSLYGVEIHTHIEKDLSFGTFLGGAALFNESWPTELQDILSRWDASSDPGRRQVGLPDTYTDIIRLNCSLLTIVSFRDGCAEPSPCRVCSL